MPTDNSPLPLLGFAAYSGTGKTTLLRQLIPILRKRGLRPALVKHSHHDFDIDVPGKDSHALRLAGADQVLVASRHRRALIIETPEQTDDPPLAELVRLIDPARADLVLVEGFRHEAFPKIELHRPSLGKPLLFPQDPHIIAVACDGPLPVETRLPVLDLNDPEAIAGFVEAFLRSATPEPVVY